jgi:Xaa-Pro dipeptidase
MVFTIEPGIYFIPLLLQKLRATPAGRWVNWEAVAELEPCGGIRIEDNVHVSDSAVENLTRNAFARHE